MLSIYYDGGKAQNGGKLHILFAGVAFATSTGACGFLAAVFLWCLLMFVILAVLVFAARRAFTGFTW
jgi:predicted lipid-binding transport protein (Tim44 family)